MDKAPHNDDAQSSCLWPYVRRGFMRKAASRKKHFRNGSGVLTSEELSKRSAPSEPNLPLGVSLRSINTDEAGVKSDLQKVRALAEARLKSGNVPDWSWSQHVQLIEAVDAMLHDISVSETAPQVKRYTGTPLRLVTKNLAKPGARRKTGSIH
jgi:hypothetical protein